jgi:hypothetical protein
MRKGTKQIQSTTTKIESSVRNVFCIILFNTICLRHAIDWLFSLDTTHLSTNKTDSKDITIILLKMALNTHNYQLKLYFDFYLNNGKWTINIFISCL